MSTEKTPKTRSWRDPDGFVIEVDGKILRAVAPSKIEQVNALMQAPWMRQLIAAGHLPRTEETSGPPGIEGFAGWMWLEHEALPFPCYPHEITSLQLFDSAELTLAVAVEAARNGWTLKDASAWNVLHTQGRPVFIDFLSFDKSAPTVMWQAYGQFVRHFVLPLLMNRRLGLTPPEVFLIHRDGVTPERAYESLRGSRLLSIDAIEHVWLPKVLARAGSRLIATQTAHKPRVVNPDMARALPLSTLQRLQRTIARLRPDDRNVASTWKKYEEERAHYSTADLMAKTGFVRENVGGSTAVLDLGCNAGEFSLLAAEQGATVVAADGDHAALNRLYAKIRGTNVNITPVMLSIGRPTPAVGWMNQETDGILERCFGRFDCVLALGLLHHLLVSERASLPMVVELLGRLTSARLIVEWVDSQDPKFRELAGFDHGLYRDLSAGNFELLLQKNFVLESKLVLPCGTRVMYSWTLSHISHAATA